MGNHHSAGGSANRHKKNVRWKSAEVPLPPGKPSATLVGDGNDGRLRWAPPRHDGGAPLQGYMVECNRVGSPVWVRTDPPLVLGTELILAGLDTGHRYRFRVSARNVVGASNPSEVSEPLCVGDAPFAPPRFVTALGDLDCMENDKSEFCVLFDGSPPPTVAWFKDGFEMFSSRRTAIASENGRSTLIIHQTGLGDEGEIKCTLTNRVGHAVSRARLRLRAAPTVRLPRHYEDGVIFEAGETILLKAGVAGKPPPMVSWSHDGQPLDTDGERVTVTHADRSTTMRIEQARRSDRGEYRVHADNDFGEHSAAFLVTVTAKPQPPANVIATYAGDKSATIRWDPPDDDGGCPVGNYIVEYYRSGWNVWLKAATERKTLATLADLIEGSDYKFRVKAESPYGVSEPSAETRSVFVPGRTSNVDVLALAEDRPKTPKQESPPRESPPRESPPRESPPARKHRNHLQMPAATRERARSTSPTNKLGSSEFMLILYPEQEKANEEKRKSLQQDLEDAMTPPAISLSAPQLGANLNLLPPMRFSVSSTELLHERAMSRMYQVMALKEAKNVNGTPKKPSPEIEEVARMNGDEDRDRMTRHDDRVEESPAKEDDYDDDYTTSTVSTGDSDYSDSDSLDEGRQRRDHFTDESNTYHPRDMTTNTHKGIPRQQHESQQVTIKTIPLPDPNFIPKPILKKREVGEDPQKDAKPAKSRPLLSKVPLLKRITKSQEEKSKKKAAKVADAKAAAAQEQSKKQPPQQQQQQVMARREEAPSSKFADEGHLVAERYGNLVRELSTAKRQQLQVYPKDEEVVKEPKKPPISEPEKKVIISKPKPAPPKKAPQPKKPPQSQTKAKEPPSPPPPKPPIQSVKTDKVAIPVATLPKNMDEINAEAESNVRSAFGYVINVFMVVVAAWLYIFKSELLAIPFLALAVYREMRLEVRSRLPAWLRDKK